MYIICRHIPKREMAILCYNLCAYEGAESYKIFSRLGVWGALYGLAQYLPSLDKYFNYKSNFRVETCFVNKMYVKSGCLSY
jgi:hypothetical protein